MGFQQPSMSGPNFRTLFESAPGLYLVLTPQLVIVAASDAYLTATMTQRDDIVGRPLFEVFPDNPADIGATGTSNLKTSLRRVIDQVRPDVMAVQKYDIRRPAAEGGGFEERHWSPVNSPVINSRGELAYIIHRVEDVSEFVRLKQRGSEAARHNEELRSQAGQMEAEVYRRAQEIQGVNAELRELQARLEQRVLERTAELRRANEELQREIAERCGAEQALRESEDQLRQSQKLEAVGRLAGGIAHDFNNLLTVILSYSAALLADPAQPEESHSDLTEIQLAGQRAADLTRQLLAFSRHQVLDPAVLDLNAVLNGTHKMLVRVLGEDVALRMTYAQDLRRVRADRGQLEQVVLNLVVNSRDAMPTGGVLSIVTENVELDAVQALEHPGTNPGPHVLLTVSDTGTGMSAETQRRVFEPFFTTKEVGKGTGLGLSTVFGIVKQNGGAIELASAPDEGTTFRILIPAWTRSTATPSGAAVSSPSPRGSETILLVEDERPVREVTARMLREAGYTVLPAASARDAVSIAERTAQPIDLLLTDVVMPGRNGRQLAEVVVAKRPGLQVLFMSGYNEDVILRHGMNGAGVSLLQKPFTPDSLARKVRQVLDGDGLRRAA